MRKDRDLSQEQFALFCGLDRSFLSNIECGKQQPSLVSIFAIAYALDTLPSKIIQEVELIMKYINNKTSKSVNSELGRDVDYTVKEVKRFTDYAGTETILIADDNSRILDTLKYSFIFHGYNVLCASDGSSAIQKFNENITEVKLIIMDVAMPNENGIDVYKKIKSMNPKMNIILTSGYLPEFLNLPDGCIFMFKPLIPYDLIKLARTTLDASQLIGA